MAARWAGGCPALAPVLKPPQFSGFWYEIAYASKVHAPRARQVVGVQMEQEGGHLALTTAYKE